MVDPIFSCWLVFSHRIFSSNKSTCLFLGIRRMIIGLRDNNGIVHRISPLNISDIERATVKTLSSILENSLICLIWIAYMVSSIILQFLRSVFKFSQRKCHKRIFIEWQVTDFYSNPTIYSIRFFLEKWLYSISRRLLNE